MLLAFSTTSVHISTWSCCTLVCYTLLWLRIPTALTNTAVFPCATVCVLWPQRRRELSSWCNWTNGRIRVNLFDVRRPKEWVMQELTDTCAGVNASSCDFTSSRSFNLLPVQSLWLSVLPILLSPSLGPSWTAVGCLQRGCAVTWLCVSPSADKRKGSCQLWWHTCNVQVCRISGVCGIPKLCREIRGSCEIRHSRRDLPWNVPGQPGNSSVSKSMISSFLWFVLKFGPSLPATGLLHLQPCQRSGTGSLASAILHLCAFLSGVSGSGRWLAQEAPIQMNTIPLRKGRQAGANGIQFMARFVSASTCADTWTPSPAWETVPQENRSKVAFCYLVANSTESFVWSRPTAPL